MSPMSRTELAALYRLLTRWQTRHPEARGLVIDVRRAVAVELSAQVIAAHRTEDRREVIR